MNEPELELEERPSLKDRLELATEAVSLLAAALFLYRMANPGGPEPLELARDALTDARSWLSRQRSYRRAMLETLQRIRDLPETEGES
jgi:hypothetical protein